MTRSVIELGVGHLEVDWGKDKGLHDHSHLYQVGDIAKIPYYYLDVSHETEYSDHGVYYANWPRWPARIVEGDGLSKPFSKVVDRLELLGHTLANCENEFSYLARLAQLDEHFRFSQLSEALARVDVRSLSPDYTESGRHRGQFFLLDILPRLGLSDIITPRPRWGDTDDKGYLVYCAAMEELSPNTVLRLLAANQQARDLPVNWAFSDIQDGGCSTPGQMPRSLDQSKRILIVTEGSSDAAIIKQAFSILRPHISDFFDFVDMEEGYPFSGTGNVFRFVQGLISIAVLNNVIVLFDNDAEGVASFDRCSSLNVPANMKVLKLPDLPEFRDFQTMGPNGRHRANINGQGAAIECYLDLGGDACVRWNNYNASVSAYQGELISKDRYKRTFLDQRERVPNYSYSKIDTILDMVVANCVQIQEAALNKRLVGRRPQ
jgi:hypothetical protein